MTPNIYNTTNLHLQYKKILEIIENQQVYVELKNYANGILHRKIRI